MSVNEAGAAFGATRNYTKLALVAGTTTTLTTTVVGQYAINGKIFQRTALTNQASPTTDIATGRAFVPLPIPVAGSVFPKQCVLVVGLDVSGNPQIAQGPLVNTQDVVNGIAAMPWPTLPETICPIGYVTVVSAAAGTQVAAWTPGSNNWAGVTGITCTFTDLSDLPGSPAIA